MPSLLNAALPPAISSIPYSTAPDREPLLLAPSMAPNPPMSAEKNTRAAHILSIAETLLCRAFDRRRRGEEKDACGRDFMCMGKRMSIIAADKNCAGSM